MDNATFWNRSKCTELAVKTLESKCYRYHLVS